MDNHTKRLFGKILGEIYRVQCLTNPTVSRQPNKAKIFGLLNGIESVIDDVLDDIGFISTAKVKAIADILEPICNDPGGLKTFDWYCDIEGKLSAKDVNKGELSVILKYFKANGQFDEAITKIESGNSPLEYHSLELRDI